ncbi:DNA-3-methyladenine glycosylase, partial [Pseudomonas aeruginosa]
QLPYLFVDATFAAFCTRDPLRLGQVAGRDYHLLGHPDPHLQ